MAALNLAIIGKNSEPLFLKYFDNSHGISEDELFGVPSSSHDEKITTNCSLRHEFIVHAALDRLDQLAGPPPGVGWRSKPGLDGMFVGLLTPVEYMRVYGYVTTTKIKFLLVVEDDAVPEMQSSIDNDIKALLTKIHELYIEDTLNPFKEIGSPIVSKTFDRKVQQYVATFNNSDGMI